MKVLANNTSALSWMQHAARTKRPAVRNLARFLQALLTHCPLPLCLQGKHLPGKEHTIADLLLCFLLAPLWGSVIEQTSPTPDCSKPCQVPRALLSQLTRLLMSDANEEMSATTMMHSSSSFYPIAGAPLLQSRVSQDAHTGASAPTIRRLHPRCSQQRFLQHGQAKFGRQHHSSLRCQRLAGGAPPMLWIPPTLVMLNCLIVFQLGPTFFQRAHPNDTFVPLANAVTPTNLWCPAHD